MFNIFNINERYPLYRSIFASGGRFHPRGTSATSTPTPFVRSRSVFFAAGLTSASSEANLPAGSSAQAYPAGFTAFCYKRYNVHF